MKAKVDDTMDRDRFRRLGFTELHDLDQVQETFLSRVKALDESNLVPLKDALHRYLFQDVKAPAPIPLHDKSAMDGFAVIARDTFGAKPHEPRVLELVDQVNIDELATTAIGPGQAVKVTTGAMMPAGADAVVKIEDTDAGEGDDEGDDQGETNKGVGGTGGVHGGDEPGSHRVVKVYIPVTPGQNILKKGEDYKAGDVILPKGRRLLPQDLGILATTGYKQVRTYRRPRVTIMATGNELVPLDELEAGYDGVINLGDLHPSAMINSNCYSIAALVEVAGGEVISSLTMKDDEELIRDALENALAASDMVITTGGTSIGEKDMMPIVVDSSHEILFHGIAVRPGSATLVGMAGDKPVVCLSGFPVAAEVGMISFVMPAIRKMCGALDLDPRPVIPARISRAIPKKGFGITRMVRVSLDYSSMEETGYPTAIPVRKSGSNIQRSMVESIGFVEITPDSEGIEEGDVVQVKLHYL